MSTEIMTMPDFLSPEAVKDELDAQAELVNPASLFPVMRLNKDLQGFMISMGDQNLGTPAEVTFLILGAENLYGSRALFQPGDSDDTTPVCSTRLLNPARQREWTGRWNDESGFSVPEGGANCNTCPWGQWESAGKWDENRGGKGSACQQRRTIYGVRVVEGQQRGTFTIADDTVIRLVLSATSIRATQAMVAKATAAKMPLSAACFMLSAKMNSRGSIKWCTLEAELVGVIGDKASYDRVQELRRKVKNIVSQPAPTPAPTPAPAPAAAPEEDVIPW